MSFQAKFFIGIFAGSSWRCLPASPFLATSSHQRLIWRDHALGLLGLAPFAGYAIVLDVAMRHFWNAKQGQPPRRMLLLRVFGSASKRVRLLDTLDDAWRRVGRIDFIAGTDLAQRHVAARALEAFLSGRLHTIFLKSPRKSTSALPDCETGWRETFGIPSTIYIAMPTLGSTPLAN
jgi:hypothetical protein